MEVDQTKRTQPKILSQENQLYLRENKRTVGRLNYLNQNVDMPVSALPLRFAGFGCFGGFVSLGPRA